VSQISPDLEQYVRAKVASGQFSSPEDFALQAMRLYRELDARHESLKSDVQAAIEESEKDRSEPLDMDSLKGELMEELDGDVHQDGKRDK